MKQANWGRIINIASVHGLVASAQKSAYVAAKHGLVGLTKVIALETAHDRHHVQRDLPGLGADAAGAKAGRRPRRARRTCRTTRRARPPGGIAPLAFVSTSQIAALTTFLCSPAGAEIRGAAWNIDGGWLAQ